MLLSGRVWLLLSVAATLLLTAAFTSKGPLQDMHWDAPIYVKRSRIYAETPYLKAFAANAKQIEAKLRRYKAGSDDPPRYWDFIRVGNTILLGTITSILGPSSSTIRYAAWLYTALLVVAVMVCAAMSLTIMQLFGPRVSQRAAVAGAVISAALYLASDVCRHLAGNFVAEVPALFLLACSVATLVKAAVSRSATLAVISGILAFALYVVKVETVWAYLSFLAVFAVSLRFASGRLWWPALLYAALVAAMLYGVYAWWFWPLPDPRLLAALVKAYDEAMPNPIAPLKLLIVAGGLLWIGVLLAIWYGRREKMVWLALAWGCLLLLPYAPGVLQGRGAEVRWFALLMAPLLLVSTGGWSLFVDGVLANRVHRAMPWIVALVITTGIAISHAEPYSLLQRYPATWRVQYAKEWLSPPRYERVSYPLKDLEEISRFIYADMLPKVVIIDKPKNEEMLGIIYYLRPSSAVASKASWAGGEPFICGRGQDFSSHKVMFCLVPPDLCAVRRLDEEAQVLYLRRFESEGADTQPPEGRVVFRSGELALVAAPSLVDHGCAGKSD